ncbi:MAG: VanZ family protein [candidate division Zixibacteria bacterium]|nr:VanZ family protein [candidate division Zixibacteria bacterium]
MQKNLSDNGSQEEDKPMLKKGIPYAWLALAYAVLILIISSIPDLSPPQLGFEYQDKLYHFIEYSIFSVFLFFALLNSSKDFLRKNVLLISLLIGASFAILDELHQKFIPGRQADVLDFTADFVGVALIQICFWVYHRRKSVKPS